MLRITPFAFLLAAAILPIRCENIPGPVEVIHAPAPARREFFGSGVDVSDRIALIGARNHDSATGATTGAAYLFRRDTAWTPAIEFYPTVAERPTNIGPWFGVEVAVSGSVQSVPTPSGPPIESLVGAALVGAPFANQIGTGTYFRGAVYGALGRSTVNNTAPQWRVGRRMSPPDTFGPNPRCGKAIAVDGQWGLVGCQFAWPPTATITDFNHGAVIFHKVSLTGGTPADLHFEWQENTAITFYDLPLSSEAGYHVAMRGDFAFVGAHGFGEGNDAHFQGAVIVLQRIDDQWRRTQLLRAPIPVNQAAFGMSVATDGRFLAVSAPGERRNPGAVDRGAVHLFERTAETNRDGGLNWAHRETFYSVNETAGTSGNTPYIGGTLAMDAGRLLLIDTGEPYLLFQSIWGGWKRRKIDLPNPIKVGLANTGKLLALKWPYALIASPTEDHGGVEQAGVVYAVSSWSSWDIRFPWIP